MICTADKTSADFSHITGTISQWNKNTVLLKEPGPVKIPQRISDLISFTWYNRRQDEGKSYNREETATNAKWCNQQVLWRVKERGWRQKLVEEKGVTHKPAIQGRKPKREILSLCDVVTLTENRWYWKTLLKCIVTRVHYFVLLAKILLSWNKATAKSSIRKHERNEKPSTCSS